MKKIIFIFTILLFTYSCQEVIDIELEDGETRLVVDALFEVSTEEEGSLPYAENGIKLSLTAPYFDEEIPSVSDAVVYITNLSDQSITYFEESDESGFFTVENGGTFIPEFDVDYELTVVYNNETYVSTTQLIPSVSIDSLAQEDGVLFEGNEIEVVVEFTDEAPREDYYLIDFDFDLYVLTEDTFYQGQTFNFSYYYEMEDAMVGKEIEIKISGIDENYYNYFNLLLEQTSQDGNPFQSPPTLLKGNILNTTNADNYAFGYFRISESDTEYIVIKDPEDLQDSDEE